MIGNIIPGLIANWMDRQGVIRTVSVVILTAVMVKLSTILLFGGYCLNNYKKRPFIPTIQKTSTPFTFNPFTIMLYYNY